MILEDGSPIAAKVKAGDTITVTSQSGKKAKLTVLGFYRDQMAYTGMMVSLDTLKKLDVPTAAGMTLVRTDGSDGGPRRRCRRRSPSSRRRRSRPRPSTSTPINKQVDQILMMFYGLLAMSVIISIFGIVNTLVLSVHERTREIGMLRAIGATRRQLGQMVRYESVITAVIGGVLGTLVGIAMGYVIVTQLGGDGLVFSLPWMQLGSVPGAGRGGRSGRGGAAGAPRRQHADPGGHPVRVTKTTGDSRTEPDAAAPSPWGPASTQKGRGGVSRPGPSRVVSPA